MGFHDDLGEDEKRPGGQIDPVEDLPAPGLGPVVIIDADLEKIIQKEDIDHGKKEPEKCSLRLVRISGDMPLMEASHGSRGASCK